MVLAHNHDVQIIWEFWPFNVLLPWALRDFLTGYGINPLFTWMTDISLYPLVLWNGFWNLGGLNPINWIGNILWRGVDTVFSMFDIADGIWDICVHTIRRITGWISFESFFAVLALGGVAIWLAIEAGFLDEMLKEMEAPADGAEAAA